MDRRVKRTIYRIKHSFVELMEETDYSEITVKMICDAADIGRKTFYLHFKDKEDLLDSVTEEYWKTLQEKVKKIPNVQPSNIYLIALEMIDEHYGFFKKIHNGKGANLIRKKFQDYVLQHIQQRHKDIDPIIQRFVMAGLSGVFEAYMDGQIKGSREEIASNIAWMVVRVKESLKTENDKIIKDFSRSTPSQKEND